MKPDGFGKSRSFLDPKVVASLAGIPFLSRRPMLGNVSGRHNSPHRGSSIEFAEYRKYVPGDDPRRLDWRAVGRTDRFYVKEYEADTNLRCVFVLDNSGSMAFSGKRGSAVTKLEYAKSIAASLAYLAVEQGDAVGLALAADQVVELPSRRNPAHLAHFFDALELAKPKGTTRLPDILHQLAETVKSRALMVVISDLFTEPSLLRRCFEHLRFRKHDVGVFHLLSPEEIAFDFEGPTRFVDMEGGPAIFVEPTEIIDRYQTALHDYLEQVMRLMQETRTDYHRVSIDEPYSQSLARFLIARASHRSVR